MERDLRNFFGYNSLPDAQLGILRVALLRSRGDPRVYKKISSTRKVMSTVVKKEAEVREFPRRHHGMETADAAIRQQLFNRELSLLQFHARVLEEARDNSNPLLERLKFLSIFSSNLDEFFMIRVSGLKEGLELDVTASSPDGMTPAEQLAEIRRRLLPLVAEQTKSLKEEIILHQMDARLNR